MFSSQFWRFKGLALATTYLWWGPHGTWHPSRSTCKRERPHRETGSQRTWGPKRTTLIFSKNTPAMILQLLTRPCLLKVPLPPNIATLGIKLATHKPLRDTLKIHPNHRREIVKQHKNHLGTLIIRNLIFCFKVTYGKTNTFWFSYTFT